jgi:hypothetical protein
MKNKISLSEVSIRTKSIIDPTWIKDNVFEDSDIILKYKENFI